MRHDPRAIARVWLLVYADCQSWLLGDAASRVQAVALALNCVSGGFGEIIHVPR